MAVGDPLPGRHVFRRDADVAHGIEFGIRCWFQGHAL